MKLIKITKHNIDFKNSPHSDKNKSSPLFNKLKNSIKKNGELCPIIVCESDTKDLYKVLDGWMRIEIYEMLHMEEFHAIVVPPMTEAKSNLMSVELDNTVDVDVVLMSDKLITLKGHYTAKNLSKVLPYKDTIIERYWDISNWDWSLFDKTTVPSKFKELMRCKKLI